MYDDSYGVEVAKLAGLPASVINRAKLVLKELECGKNDAPKKHSSTSNYSSQECNIISTLFNSNIIILNAVKVVLKHCQFVIVCCENATKDSLLILDEIGRGTSTFDGMSIARAVLEFVADKKKAFFRIYATSFISTINVD